MVVKSMINPNRLLPLAMVLGTVVIQLLAAAVLSYAAGRGQHFLSVLVLTAIVVALVLNAIRFLAWGYLHHRFPLSHVYPLTAMFFPCVLILASLRGESITTPQIIGTLLITSGSFLMATTVDDKPANDSFPSTTS